MNGTITTTIRFESTEQMPPLWWFPHDRARYDYDAPKSGGWRFNPRINGPARLTSRLNGSMPEVYRLQPSHATRLQPEHVDLVVEINQKFSRDKAETFLGPGFAFCNAGWGVFDQPRLCGGAVITGAPGYSLTRALGDTARLAASIVSRTVRTFMAVRRSLVSTITQNNVLTVKNLLLTDPVPDGRTVLVKPYEYACFVGTGAQPDGDVNLIQKRGADGGMYPIRMIMISRYPIKIPLDELLRLPNGFIPDPQWMPTPR